ncbi:MAG: vacuolar family H+-ATPase subunit H [Oribacterium sp.]|jgi:F0F1-type ATP synthase membrane subunit b/b'|nr:vacuolar family H+-ATPase subunit H [Oribacterium sp.]MDY6307231.1 vacuolar family H+-ATPase subunit H [Oribacterium sp.]MDY6316583.1 vacuolar family H+-ATPase subunit H [Oribacterium sp.]
MSRIEELIGEIEEYIDSCKFQPLSNTKILVNKEEMEELLVELRLRVPDEIKKYQRIISQQDAILQDAKNQADSMLQDAKQQTEEMVSENQIMQEAYQKANALVAQAQAQANQIVDNAYKEANSVREGAIQYTDELLRSVESILGNSIRDEQNRFAELQNSMQSTYQTVVANRRELANSVQGGDQQTGYAQDSVDDGTQYTSAGQDTADSAQG